MEKYIINGGNKLYGSIEIQSAKNSVLPILAATVLTDDKVKILNAPNITDVKNMAKILSKLGCDVMYEKGNIIVDSSRADCYEIPRQLAHELRSSVFLLGSVISRFHTAKIAYPGGLSGADITLRFPSVGATENLMLAAVKAEGATVIKNAAREPEIEDLQRLLNCMGAKVRGAGSGTIVIEGVRELHGCEFLPIPDRIEAGTFLIAAAMCGGEVELNRVCAENISSLLHKLRENGCKIYLNNDKIILENHKRPTSVKSIETQPYPGFPTDLQAQITALCCICRGQSIITENLFETRFKYVPELRKMGADVTVINRNAFVRGVERFNGATVIAHDLRGGAALVSAALAAEGRSEVLNISHIDRGYGSFEYKLRSLGGDIVRISI